MRLLIRILIPLVFASMAGGCTNPNAGSFMPHIAGAQRQPQDSGGGIPGKPPGNAQPAPTPTP